MLSLFSSQNLIQLPSAPELKTTSSGNTVYGSHKQIYQDVNVVRALTKAKFPVYLVNSKITKQDYAMKIFVHKGGQSQIYFKNECRFASLRHRNVVRNLFVEDEREVLFNNVLTKISYTMMEYAPNGNFFNFVKDYKEDIDDKLVRTYFRQLIEGLEYLHESGVSHMDLKLDNLLLDQNYTLKIADFDMAHFKDDAIIISNGTKYFRASEVIVGRCSKPKAADVYSAGITLFTMKTKGILPQFENDLISGINFADLLKNDTEKFWACHSKAQKNGQAVFDEDFKDLFISMTKSEVSERASVEMIKGSKWYNGPCYTAEELKSKMDRLFWAKK